MLAMVFTIKGLIKQTAVNSLWSTAVLIWCVDFKFAHKVFRISYALFHPLESIQPLRIPWV